MKLFALPALMTLAACGGIQDHAGINHAVIDFHEDGRPKRVEIIGGKEADDIDALFEKGDMRVEYHVRHQRAFTAHSIRADVEKILIDRTGEAAPELVDLLVKLVLR